MTLWPQTLAGRAVLVVLAGIVVSHLVGALFYAGDRASIWSDARGHFAAERIATATRLIMEQPVEARRHAVRQLRGPGLHAYWTAESILPADAATDWRTRWFRRLVLRHIDDLPREAVRAGYAEKLPVQGKGSGPFGEDGRQHRGSSWRGGGWPMHRGGGPWRHMTGGGAPLLVVSLRMPEGDWLTFAVPAVKLEPFWASGAFTSILFTALVVLALSVWAVRRAARPLGMLAGAAERLGLDVNAPAVSEEGPREVRRAARAFNEMQRRIRGFIDDRTQMLAAISHDLRTPITRLRLRAEFMDDEEQRAKMLADLDEMEVMIGATLSFARDDAAREPRTPLDLAALLQSLVADHGDSGFEATYDGPDHLEFTGKPLALKRAFGNLIGNAVKYGDRAGVTLAAEERGVVVTVEDDGPGIPPEEIERVFVPFHRVERSRSRETGGTGLGLAVVRSVVRAHGGEITLANRSEGGLKAMVVLPQDGSA